MFKRYGRAILEQMNTKFSYNSTVQYIFQLQDTHHENRIELRTARRALADSTNSNATRKQTQKRSRGNTHYQSISSNIDVAQERDIRCQGNTNPKGQGHTNRASARRTLREIEIEI